MGIKVTVKRRFVINGKRYGSLEELPEDARRAVETAIGSPPAAGKVRLTPGVRDTIVVNGHEYRSVDAMPPRCAVATRPPGRRGPRDSGCNPGEPARDGVVCPRRRDVGEAHQARLADVAVVRCVRW